VNITYMPNPNSMAARLVVHTSGMRIIFISTSGDSERVSEVIQSTTRTDERTKSPMTLGSPQPMTGPSETPRSPADNQPDISTAPVTLMRPGVRIGDSGMNTTVAMAAARHGTRGIQKSQW
jgi:hypothetical protein